MFPVLYSKSSFIFWLEVICRLFLLVIFLQLENATPFERLIHENEITLYSYPLMESYVPAKVLWTLVFLVPAIAISCVYFIDKNIINVVQSVLSLTLALGLNGVITDAIKITVGRPRPDYLWRCFPDRQMDLHMKCTGNPDIIKEGKKSFPSGHSSFAFTSFGFVALYLAGRLHTFETSGKKHSWKLCLFLFPLTAALIIALSRTCDYHHHWEDVITGSAIGLFFAYISYRHYYPPLNSQMCHESYDSINLERRTVVKTIKTTPI